MLEDDRLLNYLFNTIEQYGFVGAHNLTFYLNEQLENKTFTQNFITTIDSVLNASGNIQNAFNILQLDLTHFFNHPKPSQITKAIVNTHSSDMAFDQLTESKSHAL